MPWISIKAQELPIQDFNQGLFQDPLLTTLMALLAIGLPRLAGEFPCPGLQKGKKCWPYIGSMACHLPIQGIQGPTFLKSNGRYIFLNKGLSQEYDFANPFLRQTSRTY